MFSEQYNRQHIANKKITTHSHDFNQLQCCCVLIIDVLAWQLNQHLAQENIACICFTVLALRRHRSSATLHKHEWICTICIKQTFASCLRG